LSSNPFNSSLSPLVLLIKSLVFRLFTDNKRVQFLWVPSHVGIAGNERADTLAFSTKFHILSSPFKVPAFDLLPIQHKLLRNAWQSKWASFPPNYAYWHRNLCPTIPLNPWFRGLNISRHLIVAFTRLRIGHNLLPNHSFRLSLNSSPFCTLHHTDAVCDLNHLLFHCPSLHSSRLLLFSLSAALGYTRPDTKLLLNTRSPILINAITNFIISAGFLI